MARKEEGSLLVDNGLGLQSVDFFVISSSCGLIYCVLNC